MPMERPTREQALGLLRQFNQSEALIRQQCLRIQDSCIALVVWRDVG